MDEISAIKKTELESYRRMMTDALVLLYNDILNRQDYKYCLHMVIKNNNVYYQKKLKRHYAAINWLLNDARKSLCFAVLGLEKIQTETLKNSILKKFNSKTKFIRTSDEVLGDET